MRLHTDSIFATNTENISRQEKLWHCFHEIHSDLDVGALFSRLDKFQIAIPSWALGTGGTRFGRFPGPGEPRSLEEKIADVALLHQLAGNCGAISLHIPWDVPSDPEQVMNFATDHGIRFDAVNSNTFQDQPGQKLSYKYGSLSHADAAVRQQAVEHNLEVVQHGIALGCKTLSVWLSDGSNFPGQQNFARALDRTRQSLQTIYTAMPADFQLLLEYKPFEPNFYSTVIPDWGTSFLLCNKLGNRAKVLVDLGHHLPNTNIEQLVAVVYAEGRLGGFHFNDSKYADDDLTTGSIRPYQLFLIFCELVAGLKNKGSELDMISWMIDASHNVKDPLEDLLQAIDAIMLALLQACLVDQDALEAARDTNDAALAQDILMTAFRTDCRPLLAAYRLRNSRSINPVQTFRNLGVRAQLEKERGRTTVATGL